MASAISHHDLSDLIGRIYDCTLDPVLWRPMLVSLGELVGGHVVQIGILEARSGLMRLGVEVGPTEALPEIYRRHAATVDEAIARAFDNGLSMDDPMVTSRHWPGAYDPKATEAYAYMQDSRRATGSVDIAQINVIRSPTRLSFLGIGRHEDNGYFDDREIELLRLLIPHLRRAVTISDVLDAKAIEAERMSDTLDALKLGVVLANEDAKIVHANRAAEAMMRADGPIRGVNGRMRAERPAAAAELKEAVTAAARCEAGIGKTGLAIRLTEDHEPPVVAHVLPLANGRVRTRLEPEAVAAVFINTPLEEAACAAAVRSAYGLTPAEGRVLEPILAGRTVPEAAADIGVATTTARTHLNSIFGKTGVARQSDLIRLAASLAPAV